jgi:hypothetical protein
MNTRTSLIARAALILLGSAASFAANADNAADVSTDAQSMARGLLSGKSAHLVSFAAPAATTPERYFDAQQHAARLLAGSLSDRALANGRFSSVRSTASSPLTARNVDLQEAARHLLRGSSAD